MSFLGDDKKKRTLIGGTIIAFCLGCAWFAYASLSDRSPKETPQLKAAESKSDQITAAMQAEQQKGPAPAPEQPLPPHKGKMAAPK